MQPNGLPNLASLLKKGPVVQRLGSELGINLRSIDIRKAALAKAKSDLATGKMRRVIRARDLGETQITMSGAKHTKSQAVSIDALKTLPYVDRLIEKGHYIGSVEDA